MSGPVPARVAGTDKLRLLELIDLAGDAGWSQSRACAVLELDRRRAWHWQQRRAAGEPLDDRPSGGNPVHGLLAWEEAEILALFEEWSDVDRSHRKLAHRGSYEARVWVSPSTVDRVLARHGLVLQGSERPARSTKQPWPDWCEWRPNQLWCWDGSQFERCTTAKHAYGIIDLVSRKWIAVTLTSEPTSVSARVLFTKALDAEGLLTDELRDRLSDLDAELPDGEAGTPMLLAISDNGTEMHARDTNKFMALCSIAQHIGRPSTPTDQAWIETLWGCSYVLSRSSSGVVVEGSVWRCRGSLSAAGCRGVRGVDTGLGRCSASSSVESRAGSCLRRFCARRSRRWRDRSAGGS